MNKFTYKIQNIQSKLSLSRLLSGCPDVPAHGGGEEPLAVLLVVLADLEAVPGGGESVVDGLKLLFRPVAETEAVVVGVLGPLPPQELLQVRLHHVVLVAHCVQHVQ